MKKHLKLFCLFFFALFVLCVGAVLAQNLLENGAYWASDNKDLSRDELRLKVIVPTNCLCVGINTNVYLQLVSFNGVYETNSKKVPFEDCDFTIDNPKVISMEDGVATALSVGDAKVVFEYTDAQGNKITGSLDFHVRDIEEISHTYSCLVIDSEILCNNLKVKEGDSVKLTAYRCFGSRINPDSSIAGLFKIDNTPAEVRWWSGNPESITVDEEGFVYGVKNGGAFIHAEIPGEYALKGSDGLVDAILHVDVDAFNNENIISKEPESEPGALSDNAESEIYKPNNLAETDEPKAYFAPYN